MNITSFDPNHAGFVPRRPIRRIVQNPAAGGVVPGAASASSAAVAPGDVFGVPGAGGLFVTGTDIVLGGLFHLS